MCGTLDGKFSLTFNQSCSKEEASTPPGTLLPHSCQVSHLFDSRSLETSLTGNHVIQTRLSVTVVAGFF